MDKQTRPSPKRQPRWPLTQIVAAYAAKVEEVERLKRRRASIERLAIEAHEDVEQAETILRSMQADLSAAMAPACQPANEVV